jgi:hypothetical protein
MSNQSSPPTHLADVGQLMSESFTILKQRFWTLVGISLLPSVLMLLAIALVAAGAIGSGFLLTNLFNTTGSGQIIGYVIGIGLLIVLIFLALIYIQVWGQTALLYAIRGADERIGVREAYKRGSHKVFAFLGTSVVMFLAVLGGYMLILIPGIIMALSLYMASYSVIDKDLTGMQALRYSYYYTKGYRWAMFGRILVVAVLFGIIYIISLLTSFLGQEVQLISAIVIGVISFIYGIFMAIYYYRLYDHLKQLKPEPADLAAVAMNVPKAFIALGIIAIIAGIGLLGYVVNNSISGLKNFNLTGGQSQSLNDALGDLSDIKVETDSDQLSPDFPADFPFEQPGETVTINTTLELPTLRQGTHAFETERNPDDIIALYRNYFITNNYEFSGTTYGLPAKGVDAEKDGKLISVVVTPDESGNKHIVLINVSVITEQGRQEIEEIRERNSPNNNNLN